MKLYKLRLQKQQDRIGELVEIIATGKLPPKKEKTEINNTAY